MVFDISIKNFDHASKDVTGTATQLNTANYSCKKGITIINDIDASGPVYIGNSDVTAGTNGPTDGYPLYPGREIFIGVKDPRVIYGITETGTITVFYIVE